MSFAQTWIERKLPKLKILKCLWIIGAVLLIFSFYKAWLDEHTNVERLIVEKAQLTGENNILRQEIARRSEPFSALEGKAKRNEATEKAHHSIQDKISRYINTGNSLRTTFTPGYPPSQEKQHAWSGSVDSWHKSIEHYLETIPRGSVYLARFRNQVRSNASYPGGGMTPEWYDHWDLLSSDLARLEEFLQDSEIGTP